MGFRGLTVDETPTKINSPALLATSTTPAKTVTTPLAGRRWLRLRNEDAAISMRWGDSAITTTRGELLKAGEIVMIPVNEADVYIVAASGTPNVSVVELGMA